MRNFVIEPLHKPSMEECRLRIDNLTKPLYSLARLEGITERIAGILKEEKPNHLRHAVVIVGADIAVDGPQNQTHGVESLQAMERLASGHSATHGAAKKIGADVFLVDAGLELDTSHIEGVRQHKLAKGSKFFRIHAALSSEIVERGLEVGFALADELSEKGYQTIAIGTVGERSLLSALAVTAGITGYPMVELLTENNCTLSIQEKAKQLTASLAEHQLPSQDGAHVLATVGSPDVVVLTGLILGAASHRMAVVFDTAETGAAVLAAKCINETVMDYVFPSVHMGEPVQKAQMKYLGIQPHLFYGFEMDEALGSTMGLSVLDAGMHMLNDMKTFGEASVNVAVDGPGSERQDGR